MGKEKKSLSTSKSDPALATISVGTTVVLPGVASKKCHTSNASTKLVSSVGILGPVIVIFWAFSLSQSSFFNNSFNLSLVPIISPELLGSSKFNKFKKSPLNGIATLAKCVPSLPFL